MENQIDFKELKKELKDIEKLSKENLDTKSWASEIKLWIKLQQVVDPRKIFYACVLTSTGEVREIIQDLEDNANEDDEEDIDNNDEDNDDDDDDENSDNEDNDEDDEEEQRYPNLAQIINAVETFYGIKEDQNVLVRELRSLRIRRNEKVKDFNIRFRSLYLKLDKKHQKSVSVLDYIDSLRNNKVAWERVALKDNISLKKAYAIAEKVDRLMVDQNNSNSNSDNYSKNFTSKKFYSNPPYHKKVENKDRKPNYSNEVDDLTRQMKRLTIKTCFFCSEPGHYQSNCPKLQSIIEENRKKFFNDKEKRLN